MDKLQTVHTLVQRSGGWPFVLGQFGCLQEVISGTPDGRTKLFPCPRTGEGKTKFRLVKEWKETGGGYHNDHGRLGDGIDMVKFVGGFASLGDAMDEIIAICGGTDRLDVSPAELARLEREQKKAKAKREKALADKRKKNMFVLQCIEEGCCHVTSSRVGMAYAQYRGLHDCYLPSVIGFHPKLLAYIDNQRCYLPAWVMYVQDVTGRPVTMHRIFLETDGRGSNKSMENAKMQLDGIDAVNGCSVQLAPPMVFRDQLKSRRVVLATCEGVETGIAIGEAESVPVWCGISSRIMEAINIPAEVTDLLIYQDKDLSGEGERAGIALEERVIRETNGRVTVHRFTPPGAIKETEKSQDWLDEWNDHDNTGASFPGFIAREGLKQIGILHDE
ncbi:DUF7146 domain-containing protein [Enterovibrio norvegicus]|uniref:DUF7146 domain-containing protein n=1 Tax=Enterovibrio norvegicus TaxID=188144 RepID=UPI00352BD488